MKNSDEHTDQVQERDFTDPFTAREYLALDLEEGFMELIHGQVFKMTTTPGTCHQRVSVQLLLQINSLLKKSCKIFLAPLDVYLIHLGEDWNDTYNILQPDILVICDSNKLHDHGCVGSPDLVIEILASPTTGRDLGVKRDLYEEYGVKELWIVHPNDSTIAIHVLENGKYRILPLIAKGMTLQSPTFPDLKVDLTVVFAE